MTLCQSSEEPMKPCRKRTVGCRASPERVQPSSPTELVRDLGGDFLQQPAVQRHVLLAVCTNLDQGWSTLGAGRAIRLDEFRRRTRTLVVEVEHRRRVFEAHPVRRTEVRLEE